MEIVENANSELLQDQERYLKYILQNVQEIIIRDFGERKVTILSEFRVKDFVQRHLCCWFCCCYELLLLPLKD